MAHRTILTERQPADLFDLPTDEAMLLRHYILGQVEKAYGPNDAGSIFGSCITKRVFNLNDIETAEWAARHLGESTVYSQQISEGKSANEG